VATITIYLPGPDGAKTKEEIQDRAAKDGKSVSEYLLHCEALITAAHRLKDKK
jgi:hypothetical protein